MGNTPDIDELHQALANHGHLPTQRILSMLLIRHGVPKRTIAAACNVSPRTIYNWVDRFESKSLQEAPMDEDRTGAPSALSENQREEVLSTLRESPKEVGIDETTWSGHLVQQWIEKKYGVTFSRRHAQRFLSQT